MVEMNQLQMYRKLLIQFLDKTRPAINVPWNYDTFDTVLTTLDVARVESFGILRPLAGQLHTDTDTWVGYMPTKRQYR